MAEDPLGDRMKRYEHITRQFLPRRTYTLMRLDGRAFHQFTKGLERPFDADFANSMDVTAGYLCKNIAGTVFAYTQSDEISILMQDFESVNSDPWFGGNIQKMVSVAAGMASVFFQASDDMFTPSPGHGFDARVWTIADPVEVANYFIWRQRDCVKNSITMAAQTVCSDAELHGKGGNERQELLFRRGINWNDYPHGFKRGRVTIKEEYMLESPEYGTTVRTRWRTEPAQHFTTNPADFLAGIIPALPTLQGE